MKYTLRTIGANNDVIAEDQLELSENDVVVLECDKDVRHDIAVGFHKMVSNALENGVPVITIGGGMKMKVLKVN